MGTIWDINATSLQVFLDLATQWRTASIGGPMGAIRPILLGLDYAAADVLLRRRQIEDTGVFDDLMVMESAALGAFAEGGLA